MLMGQNVASLTGRTASQTSSTGQQYWSICGGTLDAHLARNHSLFACAGIWTAFNGDRGTKSKPIHPKAMLMVRRATAAFRARL